MSEKVINQQTTGSQIIKYAGDSIDEIIRVYCHRNSITEEELQSYPNEYIFHNLSPETFFPVIGCIYCKTKLTHESGCYIFNQLRDHWERDVYLVSCSDVCPSAMKSAVVSMCDICNRDYIHQRYDSDICRLCQNSS